MFRRFIRETGRLCRTKQTWLLVAVMVLCPILNATDFLGLGSRVYNTTISNVLMLNPARLSLYIGAFSIMVFTLLQLRKLYSGGTYIIVESAVNPVAQILLQTIAICVITVASVCAALLVLCPYTAITMKELFSFAKFMRTWVYIYLLGLLITVLLTSGVFLIFRNFEVGLILMSALMLFSISRTEESYYLTHWLQTSVTSITDGTESMLWFRIILFTRCIGALVSIAIFALGLLCVKRYSKGILGSLIRNTSHTAIPLLLIACIITSAFYIKQDPFYGQDNTLSVNYKVDEEKQTAEHDDSELMNEAKSESELSNHEIKWKEMNRDLTIESDRLYGMATYLVDNLSKDKDAQELTIRMSRGIEPMQILCNGKSLSFSVVDYNFLDYYYYQFTLPKILETATLTISFAGHPKGAKNSTELASIISEQYVQLTDDYMYLMIAGTTGVGIVNTISLSKDLTPMVTGTGQIEEIAPVATGYRTYTFTNIFGEGLLGFYNIFAGDYLTETTQVGDLKIQFIYFRNKEKIIKEMGAIDIIKNAVTYFTDLYGPLNFDGAPLVITEIERVGSWQVGEIDNICFFSESALVSSFYRADPENPDVARSAGLESIVQAIAEQWWSYSGGANVLEWQSAFRNYSTYLYIKHLYGKAYADETLKEPWYQTAKYQQNAFYCCNTQYISILPKDDAVKVYYPYQNIISGTEYINTAALFHAEELVGGEDTLIQKLIKIFSEWNARNLTGYQTLPSLDYETLIVKLGVTVEAFEAW